MRPLKQRFLRAALIIVIGAALLITAALFILSGVAETKARERLEASGATIGALDINLFTRSISMRDVEFSSGENTFFLEYVSAGGIKIIPLLREREISIRKLDVEKGRVKIVRDSTDGQNADSVKFRKININKLNLTGIQFTVDGHQAEVDLVVDRLELDSPKSYKLKSFECSVRDLRMNTPDSLYEFKIKHASFNNETMRLRIDSLALMPRLSKDDFAKKVKSQLTRTTMTIARLDAEGVNLSIHMEDTTVMVKSLTLQDFNFHGYKDKRYPFTRKEKFPLPMASFRSLPIGIEVDSIILQNGSVTYEEFPSQGFHTGHITFDDVQATMSAVNNREFKNLSGYSTLKATATLMKTGKIDATFQLPLDQTKRYTAEGSIINVPLVELNPILRDVAFVEIASGRLNRMVFAFTYDDVGSRGKLDFDYEDLTIRSLKKERDRNVAEFKTVLVNTAIKNDKTLTGGIDVERNQRKAVFNLWTKSLVDGIKNAMIPIRKAR